MDNSLLFSKINIAPLLKYPNYKHCIDVETFDKNNPKNNKVYKLKV